MPITYAWIVGVGVANSTRVSAPDPLIFTICTLGGVVGALIGMGIPEILRYFATDQEPVVTGSSVLLAFGISVGIGILFGLYPARRARRRARKRTSTRLKSRAAFSANSTRATMMPGSRTASPAS